jgi:hypothetical protein
VAIKAVAAAVLVRLVVVALTVKVAMESHPQLQELQLLAAVVVLDTVLFQEQESVALVVVEV